MSIVVLGSCGRNCLSIQIYRLGILVDVVDLCVLTVDVLNEHILGGH